MKESIFVNQYNIAITWPKLYNYIGGIIQVSRLVLWEKYVWLLNKGLQKTDRFWR